MRKLWIWLAVVLVTLAGLCACAKRYQHTDDVTIQCTDARVTTATAKLAVQVANRLPDEITFGAEYKLERKRMGLWVPTFRPNA